MNELDRGHDVVKDSIYRRVEGFGDSFVSVARTAWKMDVVYEPTVRDAWVEGTLRLSRKPVRTLDKLMIT